MESTLSEDTTEARSTGSATREGLKGLFKAQNILLDYASEQNAIAFKAVRERLKAGESTPAAALIDSVEEIFEGVVAMQKSIVDFGAARVGREAQTQDEAAAPETKKRSFPKFPFAELMRKNFEASVEAQREILGLVEKQSKLGVRTASEVNLFSAGKTMRGLAAAAKESVENVLEAQSRLVELAARQGKDSIGLIADQETPAISKDLARYAEDGIDNLRRAQTQLIEIAGEVNARVYEGVEARTEDAAIEKPASKLAERVQSGIERAIKAHNELLDASLRAVNRNAPANS